MLTAATAAFYLALFPAVLYLINTRLFRPPPPADPGACPAVSVLIPARNEERGIRACLEGVLASEGADVEVIVLDDASEDGTAKVVETVAAADARVRLHSAPPLPAGWCGKQFACFTLSRYARHDLFLFLDADVRLAPDAVARLVQFRAESGADLASGFPRQETGTILEKLLLPFINWLLMAYLPMGSMRLHRWPALGAGCGQIFLTTRAGYERAGTHAAVKASLHDGVTLPRAYRKAGLRTDICDMTDLATCRMYRGAAAVWRGLAKNAREGLGAPVALFVWTGLLIGGHVLPWLTLALGLDYAYDGAVARAAGTSAELREVGWRVALTSLAAAALSLATRLDSAVRFRASALGALLHPVGAALLVLVQWYSNARHLLGRPVGWKGRGHPSRG